MKKLLKILGGILLSATVALAQPSPGTKVTVCQGNNCAVVTGSNALKVDGSAVTQPVSGTVSAAQGGTWNINNVSGSVSLPSGAATSTLQSNLNTILSSVIQQDQVYSLANGVFAIGWDDNSGLPSAIPINAGSIPISGSVISTTQTGRAVLANITGIGTTSPVSIGSTGAVYIGVRGTYSGLGFTVEGEVDSASGAFVTMPLTRISSSVASESAVSGLTNTTRFWQVNGGESLSRLRINVSALSSGTANMVYIQPANSSMTSSVSFQGGTWTVDANLSDGTGNKLVSNTAMPGSSDRALVVIAKPNSTPQPVSQSGTWNIGSVTTLPALPANQSVNVAQIAGNTTSTGNGASGNGVQRVTIANDSTGIINSRTNDGSGNSIPSSTSALVYNDRGLSVRKASDVYASSTQPGSYVLPRGYAFIGSRTTTTGSTTTVINTTTNPSTSCAPGHFVRIMGGSFSTGLYEDAPVLSVNSSSITLQHPIRVAPGSGQAVYIYKPTTLATDTAGYLYTHANVSGSVNSIATAGNKFFQDGHDLPFGSISGTYATIMTTPGQVWMLSCANMTTVPLMFSFDNGGTDALAIGPGDTIPFALAANGGYVESSVDIQVKDMGIAATSGFAHCGVFYP